MDNLQQRKEREINWDAPIPAEKPTEWYQWYEEAIQLFQIVISRPFRAREGSPTSISLMVFYDASVKAYGTCAYLVSSTSEKSLNPTLRVGAWVL